MKDSSFTLHKGYSPPSVLRTAAWMCLLLSVVMVGGLQITDIPPLTYVNKFRTWVRDTDGPSVFRPDAASYTARLPTLMTVVVQPKLAKHSVAYLQDADRLVCFGGIVERTDLPNRPFFIGTNDTYIYDLPSNTWYTEPTFSRVYPPARVDHVSWSVGDYVLVHGGENETVMADTWRYYNRSWRMLNFPMPNRTGHTINVLDVEGDPSTAYMFGGRDDQGHVRNELYAVSFNGSVRQITTVGEFPSPRVYHASAVMQSPTKGPMLLIHGGFDGYTGLKDLFAYYLRQNKWVRINSGYSEASTSFSGDLVASITLPPVYRHSCQALFPTMICVGGRSTGDPLSFEFDVVLNRYIQQFFTNPAHVLPLAGHKTVQYHNTSNHTELLIVGGYTGSPVQFATPVTIQKTDLQMEACPYPYINPDWLGTCNVCPRGSGYNLTVNPHRCFACPMGTFSDHSRCRPCAVGTYNPRNMSGNVSSCIACPKGYFTVNEGSWTHTQCITCFAGTYADNGRCLQCPSGSYGTVQGAMSLDEGCVPCPYGSYSDLGSTSCTTCPPGTSGPSFLKALDPYRIVLQNMGQTITGQPPAGCAAGTALTSMDNDNYFWVSVEVRDFGESGPVSLNPYIPDLSFFEPSLRLYAYFQGNKGRMYYNCRVGQIMVPGCSYVMENQATPLIAPLSRTASQSGGCFQFALRFTTPSPNTTLIVKGDGLKGFNVTFSVNNNYRTVSFGQWPTGFVIGQPRAITLYAWLNGEVEPSSSFDADILVQCLFLGVGTGTSLSPSYSVDGNTPTNVQTVSIVNGSGQVHVDFAQFASGCVFKSRDQFGTVTQPNTYAPFSIQKPFAMYARLLTTNTSNWGVIRVEVRMVDEQGNTITGDSSSQILLTLWKDGTSVMQPQQMFQTLVNGVTTFSPVVHAKPSNRTVPTYGRFHVMHISGLATLMLDNITERFATHPVNGTQLQLVNYTTSIPAFISVNSTLDLEIENVDRLTGEQDASRDVWVQVQMIGCSSRITLTNHSASVVRARLTGGRGVVSLYVQGYDSMGCRLNVFEHITNIKIAKGFTTKAFNVISPRVAVRDGCARSACSTCTPPYAGEVVRYNISLQTFAGMLAPVDDLVIRFVPLGNKSAVVPADGVTERRVVSGNITFPVLYLPSENATGVRFEVGKWVGREAINITYIVHPSFRRRVDSLGVQRYFIPNNAIVPAITCLEIPRVIATKVVLTSRVPLWSPQNQLWTVTVRAVNDYDVVDTDYFGAITMQVQHCEHGVFKDLTVQSIDPVTGVATSLYTPATASNAAPFVATGTFDHGQATLLIKPLFTVDSEWNAGVTKCELRVASVGLTTLRIDAPEFRKLYPSCEVCPPGYWSPGGDGRDTSVTYHHPGGCMPCAVGTFSAYSGASTILACAACQTGFGYWLSANTDNTPLEGAIQCTYLCPYGTGGQVGGGPCISYTTLGRTDVSTNRWAQYGRIGKVCAGSGCSSATACANGQFYFSCPAQTTQAACEHADNVGACTWDTNTLSCRGDIFNCLPCPPGTTGTGSCTLCSKAASCAACDAGGWSTDRGHTSRVTNYNLARYRCTGGSYPSYNNRCTGSTTTGQCWDGSYSTTAGATDNSTCIPCPRGHYCQQTPVYTAANTCPPSCTSVEQSRCATGCLACPYAEIMKVGCFSPVPCPPGTFNNRTGQSQPSSCLRCPAGTRCPSGSELPTWVDTLNTQLSDGKDRPVGVTFYGSNDVTSCSAIASDDGQGYVQDGRISNYKQFWTLNSGASYVVPSAYVERWGGKSWSYSAVDRLGDANSGSILMNATGAIATQKIILSHELTLEMVARVWIQFNLYEKNLTKLYPDAPKPFCGLTLGVHYTDGDETDSYNYTSYAKKFAVTPPVVVNSTKIIVGWYLVEILVQPKRPVRWVEFSMLVQGYYWGNARFDDASLKPSHRRVCNCSTGYYFNESEPTSRVCRRCPPGFACSGGTMIRCVNSWSAVSFAGCQYCYDGWECDADGRGRQIPCAVYNRKDDATETCSPCPLGHACKDGKQIQCDNGFYGDGGLRCIPCQPGYYSLPGAPRWQCERCPAGSTSVAARWYCTACDDNHYSPNGTVCLRCPNGEFAPQGGANACRSCSNVFLDHYNITVSRNAVGFAIRVVPRYCEPWYKFQTERVVDLFHGSLAVAVPSTETPSVLYHAGPNVGTHTFRAFVTAGYLLPEQYADVQVRIVNNPPIAVSDTITFSHPTVDLVHALTTLMSNDYDPDLDDIFFATAVLPSTMTQYYAHNVTISPDRKTIFVSLPANFTGHAHVEYTLMDQYHASIADCVAPACQFSTVALATFWCVDAFPQAANDTFSFPVGQVYSIDVLANDVDIDGDDITITATTAGSLSGIPPAIQKSCSTCPGTCLGSYTGTCTCAYDPQLLRCYPSHRKEYFLDYTANTGVCGYDTFGYSISTNDGTDSASVTVRNTRCYCMTKATGFDMIFLLDGTQTTSDFGFQLALADAVAKRSSSGTNFQYGIIEVGANRVLRNLSNAYFDLDVLSRRFDGHRTTYTLGAGLRMAATMIADFGGSPVSTYIVVVGAKNSFDNAKIYDSLGITARFMTITVSSTVQLLPVFQDAFKNPYYEGHANSFVDLTQNTATLAENMMDIMCSS